MDRKIIVPALVLGLATVAGVAGYTQNAKADNANQRANMAQELASKLNIDQSQVTTALDQIQTDHQAERQAQVSANLDKAVAAGVITAEQKQKLIDKEAELKAQREKERTELEQWYTDNGIDTAKLKEYNVGLGMGMGPGGPGHGRGGRMGGEF